MTRQTQLTSAMNFRRFFITFLFVVGAWAAKNSDEVREFIYDNRDNKSVLNQKPAPAWVSSPNIRGTGDIIISCLVTLIACAYTAIHPTVPPGGSGKRSFMFIKAALVFVAVLGPEAVFALAFQEYLDARRLKKKLIKEIFIAKEKGNCLISKKKSNRCDGCRKCGECDECKALAMIDMKFCYFVVMGGLQVDISAIKPSDYVRFHFHGDNMPETLPLSADGVIELAMMGYLDQLLVDPTVIEDKSKGAVIQKCVVLIQVAWMGIQCIARKAMGYPVSLLEVHTFGHVLVAMLLYLFWLRKPLDVRQPVFIRPADFRDEDPEGFQDALALMVQEQFCDLQNMAGFLNLKWKQKYPNAMNAAGEITQSPAKQDKSRIVVNHIDQGSSPLPTPDQQRQQYMEPGQSITQKPIIPVKIQEVNPCMDSEIFDLGVNQHLPCGFGHMLVSQQPNWRCIWNSPDDWRADLRNAHRLDREEDNLPIRLTRADRHRMERVARHIKVVERLYNLGSAEQLQPYAYERYGSTGQHYRYLNLGYKTAFQSLKFEVDKLNPFTAKPRDEAPHFSDSEKPKPKTIDVNRKGLCEESCPRLITRYAAFLDAIFNGIGGGSRIACTILSALIGAIHLGAWNSVFPGRVESIIWKVASVTMMATVPAVLWYRFQVVLLQRYHFQYHRLGFQTSHLGLTRFLNVWYFILAIVFLLFFIAVRLFLIVESFISVRYMAYGIYFVPDWLQIFPHI